MRLPPAAVVRGNALRLPLRDESVDLIVTSPPYFALRSYRDGDEHYEGQIGSEETPEAFLAALWAATAEMWRVLKPSGSAFVQLGDKYAGSGGHNNAGVSGGPSQLKSPGRIDALHAQANATRRNAPDRYNQSTGGIRAKSLMLLPERYRIGCIDGLAAPDGQRWIARAVVIHSKLNGLPESVTDRVRRSHEDWVHLTKEGRYFAAVDEVRENYQAPDARRTFGNVDPSRGDFGQPTKRLDAVDTMNPLGKLPGSVWSLASEPLIVPEEVQRRLNLPDHFAAFGQEVVRRIVLGWSPLGGVVCDPFGGTGTTSMVARALGRIGISNDLSHDYSRLARWRIFESDAWHKSEARLYAERQGRLI